VFFKKRELSALTMMHKDEKLFLVEDEANKKTIRIVVFVGNQLDS